MKKLKKEIKTLNELENIKKTQLKQEEIALNKIKKNINKINSELSDIEDKILNNNSFNEGTYKKIDLIIKNTIVSNLVKAKHISNNKLKKETNNLVFLQKSFLEKEHLINSFQDLKKNKSNELIKKKEKLELDILLENVIIYKK